MEALVLRQRIEAARAELGARFVNGTPDWVEIRLSAFGTVSIVVVSRQFAGMMEEQREGAVRELWASGSGSELRIAWLTLVTPEEADTLLLTRAESGTGMISSWLEFAQATLNSQQDTVEVRETTRTRTVVFYSYKGGVGRTTAMLHVAYLLAQAGKRIALVDMDLEAPGLRHAVAALKPEPPRGLVDYLYERQILPSGLEPRVGIHDIVGRVELLARTKGELYIVPAGHVDLRYISMVDDLDTKLGNAGPLAWRGLLNELTAHLKPDLIFVDSRTGFSRWGAVSLLLLADEAFIFAHPNRQNLEGITPLLQAIRQLGRPPLTMVFSMVAANPEGIAQAEAAWAQMAPLLDLPVDGQVPDGAAGRSRPVFVYYDPRVATAAHLPMADAEAYRPLLASLSDVAEEASNIEALSPKGRFEMDRGGRIRLLETLKLPVPYAEEEFDPEQFQPIRVLTEILKPGVCLIRGRKGTGKSYLFRMFQNQQMRSIARALVIYGGSDPFAGVSTVPAHGQGVPGFTAGDFEELASKIGRSSGWEGFWAAYALLRLWLDDGRRDGPRLPMNDPAFEPYKKVLGRVTPGRRSKEAWGPQHIETMRQLEHLPETRSYIELFAQMETEHVRRSRGRPSSIWLLYDNLELDLPDWAPFWSEALVGLFRFADSLARAQITWLRPKIFLREDLWQRLQFANKSHFEGRQVELRWEQSDILRLAYRLVAASPRVFRFLTEHYDLPKPGQLLESMRSADDETLMSALGLIWGLRRSPSGNAPRVHDWLYSHLTDASDQTYPREMLHLLQAAVQDEIEQLRASEDFPPDRLLREQALDAGLAYASRQRCDALRADEYKPLIDFFDGLRGKPARGNVRKLRGLWESSATEAAADFVSFLGLLESIGLVHLDRTTPRLTRYAFADLYIDGFGLVREPGDEI